MRAAPAVSVPVGCSTAWRTAQAVLWSLAGVTLSAWLLARSGLDASWAFGAAVPVGLWGWALCAGVPATLSWDGQQWLLDAQPAQLTVAMDLDAWLLLSLQTARGRRWLPATQGQAGAQWHALRAALYSRAPEAP